MDQKIETRNIGRTGVKISRLGLGTVKFGRKDGVKYPHGFELPDDAALRRLLAHAQSLGINTIDTAPAYGTGEERLGELLKGRRKDWTIITKAGEEFENGKSRYDFTPAHFVKSIERSLKNLQTDYIDILLIHSDGNDLKILSDSALVQKLYDFKKNGLVRALGASTKTAPGGLKALELFDVVMATYTEDHTEEKAVLDYAALEGKNIILKKALSSGHNTDIQTAMNFSFSHPGVDSVVVGTINPNHLKENADAVMKACAQTSAA